MGEIDIEKLWKKGKDSHTFDVPVDIDEAVQGKSKNDLHWIQIILWIELGVNLLFIPMIYLWWKKEGASIELWLFVGIFLLYLFFYSFLIRALRKFDYAENVKSSLKKIYRYLDFYLLHYRVVIWFIYPISSIYGLIYALKDVDLSTYTVWSWVRVIGLIILLNAFMIIFFTWFINRVYGRKVKRIKSVVEEMETE